MENRFIPQTPCQSAIEVIAQAMALSGDARLGHSAKRCSFLLGTGWEVWPKKRLEPKCRDTSSWDNP